MISQMRNISDRSWDVWINDPVWAAQDIKSFEDLICYNGIHKRNGRGQIEGVLGEWSLVFQRLLFRSPLSGRYCGGRHLQRSLRASHSVALL